jgi:uncharacterized SAM-binding protein YcdF (DUF218 family)
VIRRLVSIAAAGMVLVLAAVAISGHFLFANAPDDDLQHADAVVVLGGEHDGREAYGISLARQVGAKSVLLSNPYSADDPVMRKLCDVRIDGIDVICLRPDPVSTRGEAMMAHRQGVERGWQRIAVVTWRFHLLRARSIFAQCYSNDSNRIVMRAVPKKEQWPLAIWEFIYIYQYVGLTKALLQGNCVS